MTELIEVNPISEDHIQHLFNLLRHKVFNISHKKLPIYKDHIEFVRNHPYRKWYLVKNFSGYVGSVYLTNSNVIGVNLISNNSDDYHEVIALIINKYKPLSPINSERSRYFLVNANPRNDNLIKALKSLRMEHIENTYAYNYIDKI